MKQLAYLIGFLALFSSCEDYLDRESPFGASVTEFYSTPEEAEVALIACYNGLNADFFGLFGLNVDGLGIFSSDLAISGRTSERDYSPFENFTQTGGESVLSNIWVAGYSGIYRCNVFLEKIDGIEMDVSLKARMIAEAKFLRGFFHFQLTRVFGDVPIVTQVLSGSESYVPRDPKSEVVEQIIKDWSEAAQDLPLKSEYPGSDAGRITKGAAQAYLMKLYVYEQRWQDAVNIGTEVINSGQYGLHDEYFDNFRVEFENGLESILEVQCKSLTGQEIGNAHYDLEAFDGTPNPRGYTQPLRTYYLSFQEDADGNIDPRRDSTIEFSIISTTLFASKKYNRPLAEQYAPTEQYDGELNHKLMRYSDFLLLYAEALNELGNTADALMYINMVRERPSVHMPPLSGLGQEDTRQAIYDERKWELGLEGHRFYDLVRWGIAKEALAGLEEPRNFIEGRSELQPIPIRQLDLNPNLTQNPGY